MRWIFSSILWFKAKHVQSTLEVLDTSLRSIFYINLFCVKLALQHSEDQTKQNHDYFLLFKCTNCETSCLTSVNFYSCTHPPIVYSLFSVSRLCVQMYSNSLSTHAQCEQIVSSWVALCSLDSWMKDTNLPAEGSELKEKSPLELLNMLMGLDNVEKSHSERQRSKERERKRERGV